MRWEYTKTEIIPKSCSPTLQFYKKKLAVWLGCVTPPQLDELPLFLFLVQLSQTQRFRVQIFKFNASLAFVLLHFKFVLMFDVQCQFLVDDSYQLWDEFCTPGLFRSLYLKFCCQLCLIRRCLCKRCQIGVTPISYLFQDRFNAAQRIEWSRYLLISSTTKVWL